MKSIVLAPKTFIGRRSNNQDSCAAEKIKEGVYFLRNYKTKELDRGNFVLITLKGKCPHLKDDGNCNVHSERTHAARNFKIGCEDCNEIRKKHGLPRMIPAEIVE